MKIYTHNNRAHSAQLNKARLQILQARDQIIDEVNNDVLKRLREQINPATYQRTLENLLVQSLMRLMEEKVDVICRECDVSIVNDLIASARAIYSQKSGGRQCEITVNTSNFLPGDRAGGLKVTARNGKIVCDNTIETRLEIALEESFPTLRLHLFGPNPNRRFFD